MNLIDTHSHLFLEEFTADLPQVINRAQEAGITKIILPNIDASTIDALLAVGDAYPGYCYPTVGLHPTSVKPDYKEELAIVDGWLKKSAKFVAIGEVGIDLYWDVTYKKEQIAAFEQQVQWSLEYGLPLIIHTRDAFEEVYNSLLHFKDEPVYGIFHSFGGTKEDARRFLQFEGFKLGINGVLTFKKSTLPEVLLNNVPIERIVLETDAPYLAPVPNRGKRNESAFMKDTLLKLAEVYKMPALAVAEQTTRNAKEVFKSLD